MPPRYSERRTAPPEDSRGPHRFAARIHNETPWAILVAPERGPRRVWLPRSQCLIEEHGGDQVTITIPAWLARDRGFVGA
jgi:hypothetical protein